MIVHHRQHQTEQLEVVLFGGYQWIVFEERDDPREKIFPSPHDESR